MQPSPSQPLADFARGLLRYEAGQTGDPDDFATGFQRVCGALHQRLSPLISAPGFHTLMARAIVLAARDFPLLATVKVTANGDCAVSGLPTDEAVRAPALVADAMTAVLAQFIGLLVTFIGENLGLRKVREIWPEVPFAGTDSSGVWE